MEYSEYIRTIDKLCRDQCVDGFIKLSALKKVIKEGDEIGYAHPELMGTDCLYNPKNHSLDRIVFWKHLKVFGHKWERIYLPNKKEKAK
jgi:hypothetical protein